MEHYIALYRIESEMKPVDSPQGFLCQAEDGDHAEEQCQNAYPDADVVWTVQGRDVEQALQDYWGHMAKLGKASSEEKEKGEEPVAYNHAFTLAFSVISRNAEDDVTAEELYAGVQRRLREMTRYDEDYDEIVESCGAPFDTYGYYKGDDYTLEIPEKEVKKEVEAWNPDSHWDAHPDFPVEDWRNEVAEDATRQSYREWVLDQIEMRSAEDELDRSMRVGRSSGSSPSP